MLDYKETPSGKPFKRLIDKIDTIYRYRDILGEENKPTIWTHIKSQNKNKVVNNEVTHK